MLSELNQLLAYEAMHTELHPYIFSHNAALLARHHLSHEDCILRPRPVDSQAAGADEGDTATTGSMALGSPGGEKAALPQGRHAACPGRALKVPAGHGWHSSDAAAWLFPPKVPAGQGLGLDVPAGQ